MNDAGSRCNTSATAPDEHAPVSRLHDREIMKTSRTAELGFKRAVVPLDGSMVAEAIVPLGMEVALTRVVVPTVKPAAVEETSVELGSAAPTIAKMLEEADAYLRGVAATPVFEGLKVLTTVRSGEAPQEIIASAKKLGADVIAMTTHGRTGLKRLLLGLSRKPCSGWRTFRSSWCARRTSKQRCARPKISAGNSYTG